MQKGVKFRIYPNKEQKTILNQTLGCCRLIYNKGLAMRNEAYQNGNKIGYSQTSAMLTDLKKSDDFAFLKAVDSIALQQSLRDLDRGFVNFFQNRASHPKFKSKHNHHLIREQRKLSRKEKGSTNRNKQRVKVALLHEKITNQRNDFFFFFSSRRRHTSSSTVSWARRCVYETGDALSPFEIRVSRFSFGTNVMI